MSDIKRLWTSRSSSTTSRLGGVYTAGHRGPYLVEVYPLADRRPFLRLYEELGIVPDVTLRPLESFTTYRDARDKWEVTLAFTADLDPHVDRPPELATLSEGRQVVELVCAALGRPFVPPVTRQEQDAVC